jgi:hypothetical protein
MGNGTTETVIRERIMLGCCACVDWIADENCALLGYYATSSDNSSASFRGNISVPSSRVKADRLS